MCGGRVCVCVCLCVCVCVCVCVCAVVGIPCNSATGHIVVFNGVYRRSILACKHN